MAKSKVSMILVITASLLMISFTGCGKREAAEPIEDLTKLEDLTRLYENVTRLTTDPANDGSPVWSPDGSKIFFRQGDYICVMNSDGSKMKRLAEGKALALSSNGSKIFFHKRILREDRRPIGWELWVMNADGSKVEKLSEIRCDGMTEIVKLYELSPDETKIVYLTREPDGYLWRRHERGELPSTWEKTEKRGYYREPATGPPEYFPGWINNWWIWDITKNESKKLLSEEPFPDIHYPLPGEVKWSPDGKKIALPISNISRVIEGEYDDEQVWVIDVESGEKEQLTFERGYNAWPDWSPDGEKLMYQRSEEVKDATPHGFDIWVMNCDGSNKKQLTDSPGHEDGKWSPDGKRIAYFYWSKGFYGFGDEKSYEDKSEIWVMNADGRDKELLLSIPFPYGVIGNIAWSPDGTRLAFEWFPNYRLGGIENPGSEIYLIDVHAS